MARPKDIKVVMLKGDKGDYGQPTDEQVYEQVDKYIKDNPSVATDKDLIADTTVNYLNNDTTFKSELVDRVSQDTKELKEGITVLREDVQKISDLGVEQLRNEVEQLRQELLDEYEAKAWAVRNDIVKILYPVGSIYISTNNVNPSTLFGGTWVAWGSGRVPVGVNTSDSNFNNVEKTGGASSVNLSHSHTVGGHTHSGGNLTADLAWEYEANGTIRYLHTYYASRERNFTTNTRAFVRGDTGYGTDMNVASFTNKSVGYGVAVDGNTGQSSSFNTTNSLSTTSVLQPYITCYMWKRTA